VTDTDKILILTKYYNINIVSSQVDFELSFQMDTHLKSSTLVVSIHVDSQLFKATPESITHRSSTLQIFVW